MPYLLCNTILACALPLTTPGPPPSATPSILATPSFPSRTGLHLVWLWQDARQRLNTSSCLPPSSASGSYTQPLKPLFQTGWAGAWRFWTGISLGLCTAGLRDNFTVRRNGDAAADQVAARAAAGHLPDQPYGPSQAPHLPRLRAAAPRAHRRRRVLARRLSWTTAASRRNAYGSWCQRTSPCHSLNNSSPVHSLYLGPVAGSNNASYSPPGCGACHYALLYAATPTRRFKPHAEWTTLAARPRIWLTTGGIPLRGRAN